MKVARRSYEALLLAVLALLGTVQISLALRCELAASITDGDHDSLAYSCQVDDRMLTIENHLDEFDEFLKSIHAINPTFDFDFIGAYIVNSTFHIPANATMFYEYSKSDSGEGMGTRKARRRRRLGGKDPVGDQRVLVLYVKDSDGNAPSYVADGEAGSMEDNIFGTYGDTVYPGERYRTCSNGHVDFVPWTGTTSTGVSITSGVYQLTTSFTIPGENTRTVEDAVEVQAAAELGNLQSQFDYVVMCLPSGTLNGGSSGWIGYAYINHYLQVMNNGACQAVSGLVHEFGHNLNLGHSGEGSQQYGDTIGFMGYSYGSDDGPLMCFNGPKTYQLGWYPNHYTTLTSPDYNWSGNLYHSLDESSIPSGGMMVIKIPGFTSTYSAEYLDYYISFNKDSGQNAGTNGAKNMVAIHTSQTETFVWAPKSLRVAALSAGETYEFTALGIDVVVEVSVIDLVSSPPYATVNIVSGTNAPSSSQVPTASLVPSQTPSTSPSSMPSPVNGISSAPTTEYFTLYTNFLSGEFWAASKSGIMFDIVATEDVMITRFDIDLFYVNYSGFNFATDVEIYIKDGSYAGYQSQSGSWTKHLDRTTVDPPDYDDTSTLGLTPLKSDIMSPILIGAGNTVAVFITNRDATNFIEMAYDSTAADYTSDDGALTVKAGTFQKYEEFIGLEDDGFWWRDVAFSGIIYYDKGTFPSAAPSNIASGTPSISHAPSKSQVPSVKPSSSPSSIPSESPSISMMPSLGPTSGPSSQPSLSSAPSSEPSSKPTSQPSISSAPSSEPTSKPSSQPSISVMPSINPSSKPSAKPSLLPTFKPSETPSKQPSSKPSKQPTKQPTISPSRKPTQSPTPAPNTDTVMPSVSLAPTAKPSKIPTITPTSSSLPTFLPTETKVTQSPSKARFQVITTRCYCRSPFRGISSTDLQNRFAAIVALLQAVMEKVLGSNRSNWGTRVVRVGNRDVRRLSIKKVAGIIAAAEDDSVEVEYEFENSRECYSEDGCNEEEQSSSVAEGLDVLSTVQASVSSGEFTQAIIDDAAAAGLTELSNVSVSEVETVDPEVEVIDITAFPTASPTFSSCVDSTFRFSAIKDNQTIKRTCNWVANHPNVKCLLDGVSSHCPKSCFSCGTCSDSALDFEFSFNGNTSFRSCSFMETNTASRCSIDGIASTCRVTCGVCVNDTKSPSVMPTASTLSPSSATTPPTPSCSDSSFRFSVNKDNKTIRRYCSWVANHPNVKCLLDGVSSHCPNTCGTCNNCVDSTMTFRFVANGNDKFRTCEWVARKDTTKRCSITGISASCRRTCGNCCSDSTERFSFVYNGNAIARSCVWAARMDTTSRCAVAEVSTNCPSTCGICCADSSERFSFAYNGKTITRSCEWAARMDTTSRCAIAEVSTYCPSTCGTC